MILKIERYKDDQRWWLVDDIKRASATFRMKYKTKEDHVKAMAGSPDVVFLDLKKCDCDLSKNNCCSLCVDHDDYRVCKLSCRMKDGSDYSVVFDTIAYLLNDNGKTIEKIVANYRK